MSATPADIKRARDFLSERGIMGNVIKPRRFATAARELGRDFSDLLKLIMRLQAGGQGVGPAPIAQQIAMKKR